MARWRLAILLLSTLASTLVSSSWQPVQKPLQDGDTGHISQALFDELEELSRVVDISYCVGTTGIQPPFSCLGRCSDFPDFELVKTWNTGPLMSDSCGFIALDHNKFSPRIIVAFRGTYSITNTIIDLSTIPQKYTPYPGDNSTSATGECTKCAVHSGFFTSWNVTRDAIVPELETTIAAYPSYEINLVGHSLGGAVALFGALEFKARGWEPIVTTFGEPRTGNDEFAAFVDANLVATTATSSHSDAERITYRRLTHIDDPVPLLPLTEWGYRPHAGEIYITKSSVPPEMSDLKICHGDADAECSAGADSSLATTSQATEVVKPNPNPSSTDVLQDDSHIGTSTWGEFPTRMKLWQLFFAHRDYFWRLGVCFQTSSHLH